VAVLERRARVPLSGQDVFAATAGGVRISEPSADLATCLALASAARDWEVPNDLVVFGEVGLGGEVRPVPQLPRRLAEASRLGFRRALVPAGQDAGGLSTVEVDSVSHALATLLSRSGRAPAAGRGRKPARPGPGAAIPFPGPRS
jgi:DNA repair protein RadA/Sms